MELIITVHMGKQEVRDIGMVTMQLLLLGYCLELEEEGKPLRLCMGQESGVTE